MRRPLYRYGYKYRANRLEECMAVLREIQEYGGVVIHEGAITCQHCVRSKPLHYVRYWQESSEVVSSVSLLDLDEYEQPACCDACLNLINYSDWQDWLTAWDYQVSREALVSAIEYYGGSIYKRNKRNKPFYQPSYETLRRYARMLIES